MDEQLSKNVCKIRDLNKLLKAMYSLLREKKVDHNTERFFSGSARTWPLPLCTIITLHVSYSVCCDSELS